MRFIKKPVVIEAIKWTGDNITEVCRFINKDISHVLVSGEVYIETLEGILHVAKGDMIIKGVRGEFYPCKPDIFEETHKEVE